MFYLIYFSIISLIDYSITLQMGNGPHSNLSHIMKLMLPHTHTKGTGKGLFSHNEAFWGKQNRLTSGYKNGLREQGDEATRLLLWLGGGTREQVLPWFQFLLAPGAGVPRLCYWLVHMWGKREGDGVGLEICQQSNIKKDSDSFLHLYLLTLG